MASISYNNYWYFRIKQKRKQIQLDWEKQISGPQLLHFTQTAGATRHAVGDEPKSKNTRAGRTLPPMENPLARAFLPCTQVARRMK